MSSLQSLTRNINNLSIMAWPILTLIFHFVLVISTTATIESAENSRSAWDVDKNHEPAGGVVRISGDGPKADYLANPILDIGTDTPVTIEQIVTHPNYNHMSPLDECGYAPLEDDKDTVDTRESPKSKEGDSSLSDEESERRIKRIVGGKPVFGQKHPWMAQIYLVNISSNVHMFHCAGTLISNGTVLTAAHCLTRIQPGTSLNSVVLGHLDRRKVRFCNTSDPRELCSRPFIRDIEDYEIHKGYSEGNLNHDIGLIYLKKPIKLSSRVRPICLPYSHRLLEAWNDLKLTAIGWGSMEKYAEGSSRSSEILKHVELDLQPRALCDKFHTRMYGRTLENRVCMGGNAGRGTCNGDSGGGVIKTLQVPFLGGAERVFQIGIISAGGHVTNTCGFQGRPIIVINVLYYMNWILNHIAPGVLAYTYAQNKDIAAPNFSQRMDGSWVLLKNSEEGLNPFQTKRDKLLSYENEFTTGRHVDISRNKNAHLLPSFKICGNMHTNDTYDYDDEFEYRFTKPSRSNGHRRTKRIVGGIPTNIENYLPWMAQVYVRNVETDEKGLRCSGTIISARHILLAAHCVTEVGIPFVFDSVVVGQYNRNSTHECIGGVCYTPIHVNVADVIVHSEYEKFTHKHNVALIRLSHNLPFTRMIQPICLPQREALTDGINVHRYFTAGWGRVTRDTPGPGKSIKLSEILLQMYVDILPRKNCDFVYSRSVDMLDRSRLCGGGRAARGECTGDGGSPLMKRMVTDPGHPLQGKVFQLGIVSFTDCGLEGMPTVYINVLYYLDWILDNLTNNS